MRPCSGADITPSRDELCLHPRRRAAGQLPRRRADGPRARRRPLRARDLAAADARPRSPPSPAGPTPRSPPTVDRPLRRAARSRPPTSPRCAPTPTPASPRRRGAAEAAGARPLPARAVPRTDAWPSRTSPCSCWRGSTTTRWRAQQRRLTIVCATSGDTGGAAVEAFRGRANVRIVALFPEGRISEVQRRFMTTAERRQRRLPGGEGHVRRLPGDAEGDVPRRPVRQGGRPLRRQLDQLRPHRRPERSTTSPPPWRWARRTARSPSPCRPATSATPTPARSPTAWACRSSGSSSAINANDILGRALADRPLRARRGGRHRRARRWTSRPPPTSSGCTSRPPSRDALETARAFEAFAAQRRARHPAARAGRHARPLRRRGGQRGRDGADHPRHPQRDRRTGRPAHRRGPRRRRADRPGRPARRRW